MAASPLPLRSERSAITGPLPPGFLILDAPQVSGRGDGVHTGQHARQAHTRTQARTEKVRCLQIGVQNAVLNENKGVMPMSVYVQLSIGKHALRSKTASYCGTSPVWNDTIQFGIKNMSPRRIKVEVFSWGLISDDKLGECEVDLESIYAEGAPGVSGKFDVAIGTARTGTVAIAAEVVMVQRSVNEERSNVVQGTGSPAQPQPLSQQPAPTGVAEQHHTSREEQEAIQAEVQQQTERDMTHLKESFPQFDEDLIQNVYVANDSNVQSTATQLLQLGE